MDGLKALWILEVGENSKKLQFGTSPCEKYKKELPVNMKRFFEIIFGDFEGIDRIIDFKVMKKAKRNLKSR